MKIRLGFVSNSSSTSFCLIGYNIADDLADYDDIYDKAEKAKLDYHHGIDRVAGCVVGLSPEAMKDDETMGAFKRRIMNAINFNFDFKFSVTENDIQVYVDGGHD